MLENVVENELTEKIISAAIEVHKTIGPGLKEEVYKQALVIELGLRGVTAKTEVPVVAKYKGVVISEKDHPRRIDILVENAVVVECKSLATAKDPVFKAQCLTYLKMLDRRIGLVLNFGRPTLKEGIERVVNEDKGAYLARMAKINPAGFRNILREEHSDLSEAEILNLEKSYKHH